MTFDELIKTLEKCEDAGYSYNSELTNLTRQLPNDRYGTIWIDYDSGDFLDYDVMTIYEFETDNLDFDCSMLTEDDMDWITIYQKDKYGNVIDWLNR